MLHTILDISLVIWIAGGIFSAPYYINEADCEGYSGVWILTHIIWWPLILLRGIVCATIDIIREE